MSMSNSAREQVPAKAAGSGLFTAIGLTAGLGTLLASSCCVIPLALGSIGAGAGTFALLASLSPYRTVFLILSFLAIGAAWLFYLRRITTKCETDGACSPP